jgi:23S rRNA pseudouridine2605 synthase
MNLPLKTEKLQKILAQAGLGSRRELEEWIFAGRVAINGAVAKLGDRASATDKISVDGKLLKNDFRKIETRLLLYHKPAGEICSRHDPEKRSTVFDHLPPLHAGRWIVVGRLDINTSGILLFTNQGEFANRLMHPSSDIEREYAVRVLGTIDASALSRLKKGVMLEDGMAHFETIFPAGGDGANVWYHVVLKEGRYHEVKRMFESENVQVSRLIRVRFGPLFLPRDLRPGNWVEVPPASYFKSLLNE